LVAASDAALDLEPALDALGREAETPPTEPPGEWQAVGVTVDPVKAHAGKRGRGLRVDELVGTDCPLGVDSELDKNLERVRLGQLGGAELLRDPSEGRFAAILSKSPVVCDAPPRRQILPGSSR
jgi:hypothetical protein